MGGEPYKVVIALNGYRAVETKSGNRSIKANIAPLDKKNGLALLTLESDESAEVEWAVSFSK